MAAAPDDPRNLQNPGRDTVSRARVAGERRNVRCASTPRATNIGRAARVASPVLGPSSGTVPPGSTSFFPSSPRARNTHGGGTGSCGQRSRIALHGREKTRPSESLSSSPSGPAGRHPSGSIVPGSTARSSHRASATQAKNARQPNAQRRSSSRLEWVLSTFGNRSSLWPHLTRPLHRTTRATYRIQAVIQFPVRVSPVSGETLGGRPPRGRRKPFRFESHRPVAQHRPARSLLRGVLGREALMLPA